MRPVLVIDSLEVGGAERYVVDLAAALRSKGYDVTVACSVGGPLSVELEKAGVPVLALMERQVKRRVSLSYAARLRALIQEGRFDLVHGHVYASSVAAALATAGNKTPLVVTVHSESRWRGPVARWVSRCMYGRAAHVIAVSEAIGKQVIEVDGVHPDRLSIIGNAVTPGVSANNQSWDRASWRNGPPVVGVVARLQPEKGVDVFLQAVAQFSPRCPEACYCIVGDGPLRRELAGRAQELGVADRVCFLGCRTDARSLLPSFDLLAVPSLSEGEPLVVLEAMEAGVPVVATGVGGIPRQIRHERDGLLVPPGDPAALGQAIVRLLRDPATARLLAQSAQQRVRSEFSYEAMLREIERCYRVGQAGPAGLRWPEVLHHGAL